MLETTCSVSFSTQNFNSYNTLQFSVCFLAEEVRETKWPFAGPKRGNEPRSGGSEKRPDGSGCGGRADFKDRDAGIGSHLVSCAPSRISHCEKFEAVTAIR